MRKSIVLLIMLFSVFVIVGCGLMQQPAVNAGYYIDNRPESKTSVLIGTNNTQSNAIHAEIKSNAGEGDDAVADGDGRNAKSSGLFVNNTVGDRKAEVDATTALEVLRDVKGTSAGQTTTKGDSSPATLEQTPNYEPTTNVPTAVSKEGATATINPEPKTED